MLPAAAPNWPLSRQLSSKGVNLLVRLLFRMPAKDASGAYRCYRVSKLRQTALDPYYLTRLLVSARSALSLPARGV